MTKHIALLGHHLSHSISPRFQQAALDHLGLDIRYEAWDTEPDRLEETVNKLRRPQNLGANVTVPYKETVLALLDRLAGMAPQIGAVNTIINQGAKLVGHNTDATGFMMALRAEADFDPRDKCAVLLGAGGAARAVAFALVEAGIASLIIFNRTFERGRGLALALGANLKVGQQVRALPWEEGKLGEVLPACELLVNCTTLGLKGGPGEGQTPLRAEGLHKDMLVYDLVYNPPETPLLKEARRAGALAVSGLSMLVYQGAASFELWLEQPAPIDIMFKEARRVLGGGQCCAF
ncbi:MAG TPA: shikimate dehydrogenase [Dehalococcoidia bacterium]|jgi:shikimate dehydrogenase|nr:shikimate dehydrogenase [Dehalococcoidia bacterium]